jgi:hypothetical protein
MKNSFVRGACALVVMAAFGTVGTATAAHSATAEREPAELRRAVAFDREADLAEATLATRPGEKKKCRFTASRNALRPRSNECRLA